VQQRRPSTVKVLGPDGWTIDVFFGLEGRND
jgi:hypothetical protein